MVDAIKRVPGVGDVQVFGAGRYAMRIWLNTEKMAALNITARDVMLAVRAGIEDSVSTLVIALDVYKRQE